MSIKDVTKYICIGLYEGFRDSALLFIAVAVFYYLAKHYGWFVPAPVVTMIG